MKKYIDPKVELIDGTSVDLSFYVWLKSREHVLKNGYNKPVKVNIHNLHNYLYFTGEDGVIDVLQPGLRFYVDKELVEYSEYHSRINKMNLQYANFNQYVLEITGSALFRDLLFNVNTIGQWAKSERFRVSTLSSEDRLLEENYPISSEYKDIPEWEGQFTKYMDMMTKFDKTDEVRLEMPYSISSVYWITANRKELINLISMMKIRMPFFYEVYGKKIMSTIDLNESELLPYVDSTIDMYFRGDEEFVEGVNKNSGFYTVNSKMGLIMYSQFLRQGSTICNGFYDELVHNNFDEFSHKVFKGDTILDITYVAHKSRLERTVSNRLCAFAMSSGDGPCSWSYFINNFLDDNLTPDQFRSLLPCKFGTDGKVCHCQFHEDVQFRNSGTEISNDPCPLPSASMELAKRKLDTDKNKIGRLYYELVEDMNK